MKTLTQEIFQEWLEMYGKASKGNDARASSELFAPDARYYETPFAEPMVGRDAIYEYWSRGAQNLKDKEAAFEIFAIKDNLGIARWQAKFTVINSSKRVALDCLFLVEFDEHAKCSVFREWWHTQMIAADANKETT